LTAILALVAIQGKFVPGLSVLDSQGQILANALIFGVAQQAFSRLLDRQAQTILEGLPGGTATEPMPPGPGKLKEPSTAEQPVQPDGGTPEVETPAAAPPDTTTTASTEEAPDTRRPAGPARQTAPRRNESDASWRYRLRLISTPFASLPVDFSHCKPPDNAFPDIGSVGDL